MGREGGIGWKGLWRGWEVTGVRQQTVALLLGEKLVGRG